MADDGIFSDKNESSLLSPSLRKHLFRVGIACAALYIAYLIDTYIPFILSALTVYTLLLVVIFLSYEQLHHLHLLFFKDHLVICGDGPGAVATVKALSRSGLRVVRICRDEDPGLPERCSHLGIINLKGSPSSPTLLGKARISRARALIAIDTDDGINAEIAGRAWNTVEGRRTGEALTCLVHIMEPAVTRLLTGPEVWLGSRHGIRFDFFNLFQTGGAFMLAETPVPAKVSGGNSFHIVVIGAGRLGKSLVLHAIRLWHDHWPSGAPGPCRVTVIAADATAAVDLVQAMLPATLGLFEIYARDMKLDSGEFIRADFIPKGSDPPDAIFICIDDESLGLSAAVTVRERLGTTRVPVVIRTRHSHGITTFLKTLGAGYELYQNITPFPFLERACTQRLLFDNVHELTARAIHEGYLNQQIALGVTPAENPSAVPWEGLPESLKESNRRQADAIAGRLESVGCRLGVLSDWTMPLYTFSPEDLERLARIEHERWVEERKEAGWTPGPERDTQLKTTPWLIPYEDLPESEKEKDRSAIRLLPSILAQFDLAIIPMGDSQERGKLH